MTVLEKVGKYEVRVGKDGRMYCTCPAYYST